MKNKSYVSLTYREDSVEVNNNLRSSYVSYWATNEAQYVMNNFNLDEGMKATIGNTFAARDLGMEMDIEVVGPGTREEIGYLGLLHNTGENLVFGRVGNAEIISADGTRVNERKFNLDDLRGFQASGLIGVFQKPEAISGPQDLRSFFERYLKSPKERFP